MQSQLIENLKTVRDTDWNSALGLDSFGLFLFTGLEVDGIYTSYYLDIFIISSCLFCHESKTSLFLYDFFPRQLSHRKCKQSFDIYLQ